MITAPTPPGRLGDRLDPAQVSSYLTDFGVWIDTRRRELDGLDAAALASGRDDLTADVALALRYWNTASTRQHELLALWDGGRVGPTEQEGLSRLLFGHFDGAPTLPECCSLCDALTARLVSELGTASDAPARLASVRASAERIRDLGGDADALQARADAIADKAERGADVGGLLGPLEADAAIAERDLIVAASQGGSRRREVSAKLDAVLAHGRRVQELAERVRATSPRPPRLAVPDPTRLGPVPSGGAELDAYADRLAQVEGALTYAESAYRIAGGDRAV